MRPDWAPVGVPIEKPSPARMYDALLGGFHNFEVDRKAAAGATALVPDLPAVALSNRAFLRRAVRVLVDSGVRQFLDVGAGIPTVGNTHEVAQGIDPQCRIAYVDTDPVAVAHSEAILEGNPRAVALHGDLRTPEMLLADPRLSTFLDLNEPVAVLLVAVLHLLTDEDRPAEKVATLRDAVAPGSYVVISHLTREHRPDDADRLGSHASRRSGVPIIFRSRAEIEAFFEGMALLEPGLVGLPQWRPELPQDATSTAQGSLGLAGVARTS